MRSVGVVGVVVIGLVGCSQVTPNAIESHRAPSTITLLPPDQLIERDYRAWQLVELPSLPEKRGIDLAEDKACRAELLHVQSIRPKPDELARLVRTAAQSDGDCRVDTDELLAAMAPFRVGGCMGATSEEAKIAWVRVAIVASTRARRAAALRNVAMLAWREATWSREIERWLAAGDAFVRAIDASTEREELAVWAVDAYENALRVTIYGDDARVIGARLAAITEGAAGDRAYALRAISARVAASARLQTRASTSSDRATAAR
jgi:hypothetical protein